MLAILRRLADDTTICRMGLAITGLFLLIVAALAVALMAQSRSAVFLVTPAAAGLFGCLLLFITIARGHLAKDIMLTLALRPISLPSFLVAAAVVSAWRLFAVRPGRRNDNAL